MPPAPAAVNDASKDREQVGNPMDFIEHDQLVFEGVQEQHGIGKLGPVFFCFKIEVERRDCCGDFIRQGCFSDLTRSDERDGSLARKRGLYGGKGAAGGSYLAYYPRCG